METDAHPAHELTQPAMAHADHAFGRVGHVDDTFVHDHHAFEFVGHVRARPKELIACARAIIAGARAMSKFHRAMVNAGHSDLAAV